MLNNSKTTNSPPRYWKELTTLEQFEVQQFLSNHGQQIDGVWKYDDGWSDLEIGKHFNIRRSVIEDKRSRMYNNLYNESNCKNNDVKTIQLDVAEIKELLRFLVEEWCGPEFGKIP